MPLHNPFPSSDPDSGHNPHQRERLVDRLAGYLVHQSTPVVVQAERSMGGEAIVKSFLGQYSELLPYRVVECDVSDQLGSGGCADYYRTLVQHIAARVPSLPAAAQEAMQRLVASSTPHRVDQIFDLNQFFTAIGEQGPPLLLVFYAFDDLPRNFRFTGVDWGPMRRMIDELRVQFLIVTRRPLRRVEQQYNLQASKFVTRFTNVVRVRLLSMEEARERIAQPLAAQQLPPWEPWLAERILHWGGRHPYCLDRICHELFDRIYVNGEQLTPRDEASLAQALGEALYEFFFTLHESLEKDNLSSTFITAISSQGRLRNSTDVQDLNYLGYFVPERADQAYDRRYDAFSPLFVSFLQTLRLFDQGEALPDEPAEGDISASASAPKLAKGVTEQRALDSTVQHAPTAWNYVPTPTAPDSPSRRNGYVVTLDMQLRQIAANRVLIQLQSDFGETEAQAALPYSPDELTAVLKALQLRQFVVPKDHFTAAQTATLERHGLLTGDALSPVLLRKIGEQLATALLVDDVAATFHTALHDGRKNRHGVVVQLRFNDHDVHLARYPWELLVSNQRHLFLGSDLNLTRYINLNTGRQPLKVALPLRLLYIAPRPNATGVDPLPAATEQLQILASLEDLIRQQLIEVVVLKQPTYTSFLHALDEHEFHVLHFDGHGTFARRCPYCDQLLHPHLERCPSCERRLEEEHPEGYLAFETAQGANTHWVSSGDIGYALQQSNVRLAVLSACSTGMVRGEHLFGGLGPRLIQADIPAVLATQMPVSSDAAALFTRSFYRSLSRYESVTAAVNAGRKFLIQSLEWFIPVLYLRSAEGEGRLFSVA